MKNENKNGK